MRRGAMVAHEAHCKAARAPGVVRRDLIRKEEIPAGGVHSVWDAKMLPLGDDPARCG
ncbi:hypothetical protein GCM10022233_83890 [Streptomyces shaanxiensis]|uniref:Uncharacterized protein n=1 Tax=Streptomyces shaanxiensis TaxID=653357 RepID=A0ABP7WHT1_9ACTN